MSNWSDDEKSSVSNNIKIKNNNNMPPVDPLLIYAISARRGAIVGRSDMVQNVYIPNSSLFKECEYIIKDSTIKYYNDEKNLLYLHLRCFFDNKNTKLYGFPNYWFISGYNDINPTAMYIYTKNSIIYYIFPYEYNINNYPAYHLIKICNYDKSYYKLLFILRNLLPYSKINVNESDFESFKNYDIDAAFKFGDIFKMFFRFVLRNKCYKLIYYLFLKSILIYNNKIIFDKKDKYFFIFNKVYNITYTNDQNLHDDIWFLIDSFFIKSVNNDHSFEASKYFYSCLANLNNIGSFTIYCS